MLFTTVAQKLNQGTQPENGPFRSELDEGSGRLFWYFFLAKQKSTKMFGHLSTDLFEQIINAIEINK